MESRGVLSLCVVFLALLSVGLCTSLRPPVRCPPNKPPVKCIIDPCRVAKCDQYPGASCVANYCGGCNAVFYVNGSEVNCNMCPPGKSPVKCFRDPCQGATCAVPGAKCISDYCGGCFAKWYVSGKQVNCSSVTSKCPPNKPPVQCFRDPCQGQTCSVPNSKCVSDYCGGCYARWYVGSDPVNCQEEFHGRDPVPCPDGLPVVNCLIDPCLAARCPASPNAKCYADYCGGCNAKFYANGNQVEC